MKSSPNKRNFLLEIGTEEIPARFFPDAIDQLKNLIADKLTESGIACTKVEGWATPRRMAVYVTGLPQRAADRTDLVIGPPPKAAKDEKGQWTNAATGFARTQGVSVSQLLLQSTSKGDRYVVQRLVKGQQTETILKQLSPEIIRSMKFPKTMIWEKSGFRFARPIRWIVALLNSQIIRFKVAEVISNRNTYGLWSLGSNKISITRADKYKLLLQGRCVLVDPIDRESHIRRQMDSLCKKINTTVVATPEQYHEVVFLTAYPTCVLGQFKEEFLSLPREVLISSLVKHQKFFPLEKNKGQLSNFFIGVRNGPSENQDIVKEGYERVINARLADAKFFFDQDKKTSLDQFGAKLTEVGFLENLGSLLDKTNRVEHLVHELGRILSLDPNTIALASRAATLAKADLLTQMVGEFPELQGIAGRFYSQNEDKRVSDAIEQHYWPLTAEGQLPTTIEGALVSIADKLDSLAAHFSVGNIPTGSADPHALRRISIGLIRILIQQKWDISLSQLVHICVVSLPVNIEVKDKAQSLLLEFLRQRCLHFWSNQGYRLDEVEAVIGQKGNDSIPVLKEKLDGIKAIRGRDEFTSMAAAIKRARNILRQAQEKGVLPPTVELSFDQLGPSEQQLAESLNAVRPKVVSAIEKRKFREAILELAPLRAPVDSFFENVMVMVDNENERTQRLSLLMSVRELFDSIADFSKLQETTSNGSIQKTK